MLTRLFGRFPVGQRIEVTDAAIDAYHQDLEERQSAGDFVIEDKDLDDAFSRFFRDDSLHALCEAGNEEESLAFAVPPWDSPNKADCQGAPARH